MFGMIFRPVYVCFWITWQLIVVTWWLTELTFRLLIWTGRLLWIITVFAWVICKFVCTVPFDRRTAIATLCFEMQRWEVQLLGRYTVFAALVIVLIENGPIIANGIAIRLAA